MENRSRAQEFARQAAARLAEGDLLGAEADFTLALAADATLAEIWNNRGAARQALGKSRDAATDFTQALALRPEYAEAYNNRGITRHALGEFNPALEDFDRAIALRPRYAEALSNRATTRQTLGDFLGALADLDRSLGIRPQNLEGYLGRAAILEHLGEFAEAVADYDHVLGLLPQPAALVFHLRARVHVKQKRFAEAVADCTRALEIDPKSCMAYISRGNARYHLRDPGGIEDYRTAFGIHAQAAAGEIVRILYADLREDLEEVLENCRKHLRINVRDVIAWARQGLTYGLLGKQEEAARALQECVRLAPEDARYFQLLLIHVQQCQQEHPGKIPA